MPATSGGGCFRTPCAKLDLAGSTRTSHSPSILHYDNHTSSPWYLRYRVRSSSFHSECSTRSAPSTRIGAPDKQVQSRPARIRSTPQARTSSHPPQISNNTLLSFSRSHFHNKEEMKVRSNTLESCLIMLCCSIVPNAEISICS